MRIIRNILLSIYIVLVLFGCRTIASLEKGMTEYQFDFPDNQFCKYYAFYRQDHNKHLVICIGGSGYSSVLGTKKGLYSTGYSSGGILNLHLSKKYDLLLIEKPNLVPYQSNNQTNEVYKNYTVDNLSKIDAAIIDEFITNHNYTYITMFGHSEGGILVPAIYKKLKFHERITNLVIAGSGGLSQEKQFKILYEQNNLRIDGDITLQQQFEKIYENNESIDMFWIGHPYIRWASFFRYQSLDDLIIIDIPILIEHGRNDTSVPVESSRIVKDTFISENKTNLTYFETESGHGSIFEHLKEIEQWIDQNIE